MQGSLDTGLLLKGLVAVKNGDFSTRLPEDWTGVNGKIADAFNEIVSLEEELSGELKSISKVVGEDGKTTQRLSLSNARGAWAEKVESVNALISDLVWPANEMARVIGAVGKGDLTQSMSLEAEGRPLKGEFLRMGKVVNNMVAQLGTFASEVIRMPGGGGLAVLQDIKANNPERIAIILTSFPFPQYRQAYLAAGADYFFDKTKDIPQMIETLIGLAAKNGGSHAG
jgi:DNA-binding NarL/FixJ family response regulator